MKDFIQSSQRPAQFMVTEQLVMSLLSEMELFLAYLAQQPLPLSGTKHLPAVKWLESLNGLLPDPDVITLTRPQPGHFSTALALYLLARASGLGRLETVKSRQMMVLNQAVFEQWQAMTDEERYFNLLESFCNRLHCTAIGDRSWGGQRLFPSFVGDCLFGRGEQSPEEYLNNAKRHNPYLLRRFYAYGLRLFALFGMANVEIVDNGKELKEWSLTPWGIQLITLSHSMILDTLYGQKESDDDSDEYPFKEMIQVWCPTVQGWLSIPDEDVAAGYILKVSLDKECWRKLAVPSGCTLEAVAMTILRAFRFDEIDHLYHFEYLDNYGAQRVIAHEAVTDVDGWADLLTLADIHPRVGMTMKYVFDYGENWIFDIRLEKACDQMDGAIAVKEKHGKAPKQCAW